MTEELFRVCKFCNYKFKVSPTNQYSNKPKSNHIFCSTNCKDCMTQKKNRSDPEFIKKKKILSRDRYIWRNKKKYCSECNSKDNLEIHHITYSNTPNDIIVLCEKCHVLLHNKIRKGVCNA